MIFANGLQLFHGRRARLMEHRGALAAAIHPVEHQAVEMNIQVGGGAKALDEGDGAGVGTSGDADAHQQWFSRVSALHCLNDLQRRAQRPLGVFFMGFGPTKVSENAIADIAGDIPFVTRDDLTADSAIVMQQRAQFFGIEFLAERRGTDQVAEHHGELAAFAGGRLRRR